jgi:hypothetical protein
MIPAKASTLLKLATMLTFLVAFDSACGTTQKIGKPDDGKQAGASTFKITFHPWMLYVVGMKTRSEVPDLLMDVEPDTQPSSRYDLVTTTGTYENVTLQSVINQSGDRYDVGW